MLTRATTSAVAHRASSMRRMRRRAAQQNRLYCNTNGCTSFLVVDEAAGTAHCEICGYTRKLPVH
jgi:transcription elongation factor Elf1